VKIYDVINIKLFSLCKQFLEILFFSASVCKNKYLTPIRLKLLNADADLVTIQDLLGHSRITATQCYCRVSNLKVQRDYYKAMSVVLQRTQPIRDDDFEWYQKGILGNRI